MSQTIVFNGVEYAGPDAMPADVRQQYERILAILGDSDDNGVPDVMERPLEGVQADQRIQVHAAGQPDLLDGARTLGGQHINVERTFTVTYLGGSGGHGLRASPSLRGLIERAVFIGLVVLLVLFIVLAVT